jgi:hypothetical protein
VHKSSSSDCVIGAVEIVVLMYKNTTRVVIYFTVNTIVIICVAAALNLFKQYRVVLCRYY